MKEREFELVAGELNVRLALSIPSLDKEQDIEVIIDTVLVHLGVIGNEMVFGGIIQIWQLLGVAVKGVTSKL